MAGQIDVDPDAVDATGSKVLRAADRLSGLGGSLSATSFGGSSVETTQQAYARVVENWSRAADVMAGAIESLGDGLRGAAAVYREVEDGAMRGD